MQAASPHSQWRDRTGFSPDFPIKPLLGAKGTPIYIIFSELFYSFLECDNTGIEVDARLCADVSPDFVACTATFKGFSDPIAVLSEWIGF